MASVNYKAEGIVFDIQRFNVHDGPGIRTVVFLKGCPLTCLWCSNPESQKLDPEIMHQQDQCISCGKCLHACKYGAVTQERLGTVDRNKCVGCGECANICPTGALVLKGESMTVEQVIQALKKDYVLYRKSGGGVTLSGGEPLVQWKFTTELLKACKAQGWHTAMETSAFCSEEAIESVFPFLDLTLLDIKSMDDHTHKAATGVTTEKILQNAVRIAQLSKVIIRVPVIPSINATEEDLQRICDFTKKLKDVDTIHLLPYHAYGENKYELLGLDYPMGMDFKPLDQEDLAGLRNFVENQGLKAQIGG